MAAAETIHGFQKFNVSCQKNADNSILFHSDANYKKDKKNRKCAVCKHDTGYGNIILLKRKIKIVDGKLQRSKSSIFDAGETIISQKHVKIVEYVRLIFARTHTVICCIKKPRKSRGIKSSQS